MQSLWRLLSLCLVGLLLGCTPAGSSPTTPLPTPTILPIPISQNNTPTLPPPAQASLTPTATPSPSQTASPTTTPSPTPTATASPTVTLTPTPVGPCNQRQPADNDLLVFVNRTYGLSPDYRPDDLVPLADYLSVTVTKGYPTQVRQIIIEPLLALIADMEAAGLRPQIISGFRDYYAQALARDKWLEQYPDWASNLSAPPGHSEHQLGTTIDFGSPELPAVTGIENIEFHTYFYMTSEGQWLAEHARDYGFTMSYPANQFEVTTFYYEPWHFRYVGLELANYLYQENITLSEYLVQLQPEPCLLDD